MGRISTADTGNGLKFTGGAIIFGAFFAVSGELGIYMGKLGIFPPLTTLILLAFVIIATYLLFKISKYAGWGFVLTLPATALFFAMVMFELWIHPPEE